LKHERALNSPQVTTMKTDTTFTILSTRAPLEEVDGDAPYYMLPGGVSVGDGARKTAPLDLRARPVRKFRVQAPHEVGTAVIVTDSPYGSFVQVRRCVEREPTKKWWHPLAAKKWPRVGGFMQQHARSLLALWFLLTDEVNECHWMDIGDATTNQVFARGGDVVIITFVNAEGHDA
jgi:hypothetical protein